MSKIIVYGLGNIFKKYMTYIDIRDVVALIDKDKSIAPIMGIKVEDISVLNSLQYDYIVVFNKSYCDTIMRQLHEEYYVPQKKIMSWSYYIFIHSLGTVSLSDESRVDIREWSDKNKFNACLDISCGIHRNGFFTMHRRILPDYCIVDNYAYDEMKETDDFFYNRKIKDKPTKFYDVIVCLDFFINHRLDQFEKLYAETYSFSKYIVLSVPQKGFGYNDKSWDSFNPQQYNVIKEYVYDRIKLYIIEKNNEKCDLKVFIATHKEFNKPKDDMYVPIFAGKGNDNELKIQGDAVGDNVSSYNEYINELTVLYYIWKHTNERYVGLNHYRRYFGYGKDVNDCLSYSDIKKYLSENKIIVAPASFTYPYSIKEHLRNSVDKSAFEEGTTAIRNIIKKKSPEYLNVYDEIFNGFFMYPCNMFIMNREQLEKYCSWLFGIILDACEMCNLEKYDSYSKRIIGFIAERLFTVWIIKNRVNIKEMPMMFIDS